MSEREREREQKFSFHENLHEIFFFILFGIQALFYIAHLAHSFIHLFSPLKQI